MPTVITDFGEGSLSFGGGANRICQVTACTVVSSNTRQDIVTACGTTTRFIKEQFSMTVSFMQDWTSTGISRYLWDNYNTNVAFAFSTDPDGTPAMAGTATIPRPSLGGAAGEPMADTLTFPIVGTPTPTTDV